MAVEVELGAYIYDPHCEVFSHNPLHDIESLWWVGIWFLLCHYEHSIFGVGAVQKHVKVVKKFSQTLFNNRTDSLRRSALTGKSVLLANANPRHFPSPMQRLLLMLDNFRVQLITYYITYKPSETRDRSFFTPDVHREFADIVEQGIKASRNDDCVLWPMDYIETHITSLNAKK